MCGLEVDRLESGPIIDKVPAGSPGDESTFQYIRDQTRKHAIMAGKLNLDQELLLTLLSGGALSKRRNSEGVSESDIADWLLLLMRGQSSDWNEKLGDTGWKEAFKRVFNAIRTRWQNRPFFITRSGRMGTGMTNRTLQAGDVVCYIFGDNEPFILRPKDGRWTYVGHAYIHGITKVRNGHDGFQGENANLIYRKSTKTSYAPKADLRMRPDGLRSVEILEKLNQLSKRN